MVSKNNKYEKQLMALDRQVPHYGLRKLGIGVVSVLLGTSMYFGLNTTVAKADETAAANDANGDSSAVNQTGNNLSASAVTLNSAKSVTATAQSGSGQNSASAASAQPAQSGANISAVMNINPQKLAAQSAASSASSSAVASTVNSQSSQPASFANTHQPSAASSSSETVTFNPSSVISTLSPSMLGESKVKTSSTVTLDDGSTLTADNTNLDSSSNSAVLTFSSNAITDGSTYVFKIPKNYVTMNSTDVASLTTYGSTTFDSNSDPNYYIITDRFTKSGTVSQAINLSCWPYNYIIDHNSSTVYPGEKLPITVTVSKTGGNSQNINLSYTLPTTLEQGIYFGLATNIDADPHESSSSPVVPYIYNNVSAKYAIALENYGISTNSKLLDEKPSQFNNGIKIDVQVPEYFSLDSGTPITVNVNGVSKTLTDATISQAATGQDVIISIPANSKDLDFDKLNYQTSGDLPTGITDTRIYFNGTMKVPTSVLSGSNTYFTNGTTTLTQTFFDNTTQQLSNNHNLSLIVKPYDDNVTHGNIFTWSEKASGQYLNNSANKVSTTAGTTLDPNDTAKYTITNISNTTQTLKLHLDYPDGLQPTTLMYNIYGSNDAQISATFTYSDGTTTTATGHSITESTNNRKIQSADLTITNLDSLGSVVTSIAPYYDLAEHYSNGTALANGDNLRTKLIIDGDTSEPITQTCTLFNVPLLPAGINGFLYVNQTADGDKTPGDVLTRSNTTPRYPIAIQYMSSESSNELILEKPVVYLKLPNNASIASLDSSNFTISSQDRNLKGIYNMTPASISILKAGTDQFLKIDLSNYDYLYGELDIDIHSMINNADAQTSNSPVASFITAANDIKDYIDSGYSGVLLSKTSDSTIKSLGEELTSATGLGSDQLRVIVPSTNWQILTASGTHSVESAQGNANSSLVLSGASDLHKGDAMTFSTSIVNATDTALTNVESVTNLPNTSDGASQFNVNLTGPAKIVNAMTGAAISGATIKYSTQAATLSSSATPDVSGFVDGSQISDWSTVKAILVTIPTLAANTSARLVLPGQDKTIFGDTGKKAYLASETWSTETPKPWVITAGSTNSANITVNGTDTVHVQVHYKDAAGTDHYISLPDKDKTYNDNAATMQKTDFLTGDSSLTTADKTALSAMPSNYRIDYSNPTVKNSTDTYSDDYPNNTAAFGQTVKYYFDNDTVVYEAAPVKQKLTVTFIDDTTGKTLKTVAKKGADDSDSGYSTVNDINIYKALHYNLVSDSTNGAELYFDHDDSVDQTYTVHLTHAQTTTTSTAEVPRTINYVYSDGRIAAPSHVDTPLKFTETKVTDAVTSATVSDTWAPASQDFTDVTSPTISGYTPDKTVVSDKSIAHDHAPIVETVTYTPATQKLTVTFIDDTTKQTLKTVAKSGNSDSDSGYNTLTDISNYRTQGYDLVSDSTGGIELIFDHDSSKDQTYTVHLTHHLLPINETKTIKETIKYQYTDGSKAFSDFNKEVTFTRTGTHDEVTNTDDAKWTNNQDSNGGTYTFAAVTSPTKTGYTADQTQIAAQAVTPTSQDINKVVIYSQDNQPLDVAYIDDTDAKTLETWTAASGKPGATVKTTDGTSDYTTAATINKYKQQGYELVYDPTNGSDLTYGETPAHYVVHLKHGITTSTNTKTVKEDIEYRLNSSTGTKIFPDATNQVTFTQSVTHDNVTNKDTLGSWQNSYNGQSDYQFNSVTSPLKSGYTADTPVVAAATITPTTADIQKVVIYTPDTQKMDVTYVDDVTGQTLKPASVTTGEIVSLTGKSDADAKYNTKSDIAAFENEHYVLVSDSTNGQELYFDDDDQVDQHYVVHLTHATKDITDSAKVGETIHYVYADASHTKAHDDYVATPLTFTRTGKQDLVSGTKTWNDWQPAASQNFAAVTSPAIAGYTPDLAVISAHKVTPGDQDLEYTVTYTPEQQGITVNYIDQDRNQLLSYKQLTGKSGADANYNTKQSITDYENQGYELVTDETNGAELKFDTDVNTPQIYNVYLKHKVDKNVVVQTIPVTMTVNYLYANGPQANQKAADSNTQTITFTNHQDKDEVTKQFIGQPNWTSDKTGDTFADVTSPTITGYMASQQIVKGAKVDQNSADITVNVYYKLPVEQLTYTVIDDDNAASPVTLKDHIALASGDADTNVPSLAAQVYDAIRNNYLNSGYQLDTTKANGQGYDTLPVKFDDSIADKNGNDSQPQNATIYLKHANRNETTTVDVPRTINYVYSDGRIAATSHADSLHFTDNQKIDSATGKVLSHNWTPAQDFSDVASPTIAGYTPDKTVVSDKGIAHDHGPVVEVVTYTPDAQKATVTYIDDNTGETLKPASVASGNVVALNGKSNADSGYNTKADIAAFEAQHYILVSDSSNGQEIYFDADDQNDQSYVVHLKHATQPATQTAKATEVVHYVYADGTKAHDDFTAQPAEFTRNGTTDLVTNKTAWDAWQPAGHTFAMVASPVIAGYTPDQARIATQTAYPNDKLEYTVTYTADQQAAHIHYIDVNGVTAGASGYTPTDGTELVAHEQNIKGKTGATATDSLWNYAGAHYELAQPLTNGQGVVFANGKYTITLDNDSNSDQDYYVYLKHSLQQVVTPRTVHETINYYYGNGPKAGQKIYDSYTAPAISFNGTQNRDLVTGQLVGDIAWTPSAGSFAAHDNPTTVKGYSPAQKTVAAITVNPDSPDQVVNVSYYADQQKLNYQVIDDTTGTTLVQPTELAAGDSDSLVPAAALQQYGQVRDNWLAQGYKLDVAKAGGQGYDNLPNNFDSDDQADQLVTIYLVHDQKWVPAPASANKVVHETISYQYGNGPKRGQTAAPAYTKDYTFTAQELVDAVDGKTPIKDSQGNIQYRWSSPQMTETVMTPAAYDTNYVASDAFIPAQRIDHNSQDINKTIYYTVGDQTMHVHYLDVNGVKPGADGKYTPTQGNELLNHEQTQKGEAGAKYTNTLWDFASAGYKLAQEDQGATSGTFDDNSAADQNYYVYLIHDSKDVAVAPKTINETINYVFANGPHAGDEAAPVHHAKPIVFTGTQTVDQVTGKAISPIAWTPVDGTAFAEVASPAINGYHPDQSTIGAVTVTPQDSDRLFTVKYMANPQKLTYSVVDDTTGETLLDKNALASGDSDSTVPMSVNNTYSAIRQDWLSKGYQLDQKKDNGRGYDELPDRFDHDDQNDQNVVIYLVHGQKVVPAKDSTDVVEVIHYVYGNGPKKGQAAHTDYVSPKYHFTTTQLIDTVTNKPLAKEEWSGPQKTDVVSTPAAADKSYTPDQAIVPSQLLTHDQPNGKLELTVNYYVGQQNVHVHYRDVDGIKPGSAGYTKTDGHELADYTQNLRGNAGDKYTNTLWDYASAGYKLAQEDQGAINGTFDDDSATDQDYYVYLVHDTNVVNTSKTIKETINYLYQNGPHAGQTAAPSVNGLSLTFAGTQIFDKVTGKALGDISWTPKQGTFNALKSPVINGYKADKPDGEAITVTPNDSDQVLNVYYTTDMQNLTYTVIDDTTGTILRDHNALASGSSDSTIPMSVGHKYDGIRQEWLAKGYVLDKTKADGNGYDFLPDSFDHDDQADQNVTIYLVHGQKTVPAKDSADVVEIIHYVYGNGPKKGQAAHTDYVSPKYHFTTTQLVDTVTNKPLAKEEWSGPQKTEIVFSPVAQDKNYTADQNAVPSQTLTYDQPNGKLELTVHYYVGKQNVHIHYVDVNGAQPGADGRFTPEDGNELLNHEQTQIGDAGNKYSNKLWNFAGAGYKLAQEDQGATNGTFDDDSATDQNYYVYLTHDTENVTVAPKTVNETINYLYQGTNDPIHASYHAKGLTFTGTQAKDKVTGQLIGKINWLPASQNFAEVASPVIAGYTPDQAAVSQVVVDPASADVVRNVYYAADQQKLTYTVVDDATGKVLVNKGKLATGKTASALLPSTSQRYSQIRNSWLAKGYVLDTTKADGQGYDNLPDYFDSDTKTDQNVTIYLTHGHKTVPAKEAMDVVEIIHYVYGNGPKKGQTAHSDYVSPKYHFTATETIDTVTKKPTSKLVWSGPQKTDVVITPMAVDTNYVPAEVAVPSQTLTYDQKGGKLELTVNYYVGAQKVNVHYIDVNGVQKDSFTPTDGQELLNYEQTLRGQAGAKYTNKLWDFAAAGYQLATKNIDPLTENGTFDDDSATDQNYYVYLKHTTEPVVSHKTVNETINYLYANGTTAKPSHHAQLTFNGTQQRDKVTGKLAGDVQWTPAKQNFTSVTSPTIAGYVADQPIVAPITINPDSNDHVINVYYAADQQALTYTVVDDTTGKTLVEPTALAKGDSGSLLPVSVLQDYDAIRNSWLAKGYALDTAKADGLGYDMLPARFDNDPKSNQNVTIYLVHTYSPVNPDHPHAGVNPDQYEKNVKETIHYTGAGRLTPADNVQTSKWSRTLTVDNVTGKLVPNGKDDTDWAIEKGQKTTYSHVDTPAIEGYLPDQTTVPATKVTMEDVYKTVSYAKQPAPAKTQQIARVIYLDQDAGNKTIANSGDLKGNAGDKIDYSTAKTIAELEAKGYELVYNGFDPVNPQGQASVQHFDNDGQVDQIFTVVLKHKQTTFNPDNPGKEGNPLNPGYPEGPKVTKDDLDYSRTVKETVHYTGAGDSTPADNVQTATWSRSITVDNVTGQIISRGDWKPSQKSYDAVETPSLNGYKADKDSIPAGEVTMKDKNYVVTYQAVSQPTAAKPTAPQPSETQPTAAKPTAPQPSETQPTAAKPTTPQASTAQPTAVQPTVPQTSTTQSTTAQLTTPQLATPQAAENKVSEPVNAPAKTNFIMPAEIQNKPAEPEMKVVMSGEKKPAENTNKLPQTGNDDHSDSSALGILGLFGGLMGGLGAAKKRRHKND